MEPLASRMRPATLDDIFGQEHILGKDKMLRRSIEADMLSSIILYGPSGTGKTTIASVIANMTKSDFHMINGTTAGKADMKAVVDMAMENLHNNDKKTILFIDEIHRFNKAQQDFLLPFVENGVVILIGATTENPYFEVNHALCSRSQIFELKPLDREAIRNILLRAVEKIDMVVSYDIELTDEAVEFFVNASGGDARQVLNGLDLAFRTTDVVDNRQLIDVNIAAECIQRKVKRYDKDGDNHYDTISAFIESMKHSEVDAALYYLARMLDGGEDPKYIARRLIVSASRDIGVACPEALTVANNAFLAVERVGLPECADALAMSTIFNSMAPKSDTVAVALAAARQDAEHFADLEIPAKLRDESYKSAWKLGHGGVSDVFASEYNYDGFECMPEPLIGRRYFYPSNMGAEPQMQKYLEWMQRYKANMIK